MASPSALRSHSTAPLQVMTTAATPTTAELAQSKDIVSTNSSVKKAQSKTALSKSNSSIPACKPSPSPSAKISYKGPPCIQIISRKKSPAAPSAAVHSSRQLEAQPPPPSPGHIFSGTNQCERLYQQHGRQVRRSSSRSFNSPMPASARRPSPSPRSSRQKKSGANSFRPILSKLRATPERSGPTPTKIPTTTPRESSAASAATQHCSTPAPSSNPAPAGPVSGPPSQKKMSRKPRTSALACSAPQ